MTRIATLALGATLLLAAAALLPPAAAQDALLADPHCAGLSRGSYGSDDYECVGYFTELGGPNHCIGVYHEHPNPGHPDGCTGLQ
ncbi:MAG TPA: hypothetical protein VHH36_05480 [Candidatus Thermoplasmatota archaeon]|nr:hypothetical protein [Candidatus Thermoplasmatota archaeon]